MAITERRPLLQDGKWGLVFVEWLNGHCSSLAETRQNRTVSLFVMIIHSNNLGFRPDCLELDLPEIVYMIMYFLMKMKWCIFLCLLYMYLYLLRLQIRPESRWCEEAGYAGRKGWCMQLGWLEEIPGRIRKTEPGCQKAVGWVWEERKGKSQFQMCREGLNGNRWYSFVAVLSFCMAWSRCGNVLRNVGIL